MASVITKTPRSIAGLSLSRCLSRSPTAICFSSSFRATRRIRTISGTARQRSVTPTTYAQQRTLSHTPRLDTSTASNMVAENYEAVLKGKYPGKDHAKRVVDLIRKDIPDANGIIYLESQMTRMMEDSDEPQPFRQRRYFYYLTGCNLPDCHFIYDIQSSKSTLFIPPINPDDVIWSGLPVSIDEALAQYDVDEVKLTTELNATLAHLGAENPKSSAFAIANQISDHVSFIGFDNKNFEVLKNAIEVSRVVKDEYEIAMLRKANYVSGIGHRAVFAKAKAAKNEQELEAAFMERCFAHGCKKMSYDPISAAGRAAATLHYVGNDAPTEGKLNLLMDAGCEYNNYAADITRTFPLSGKFTKESRHIYETVLKMQKACIDVLKEGVLWDDVHVLAHQIAIDGLLEAGILKGDKDEILKARTSAAFLPHGLGHYLGMDTHDTGGNPNFADKDKLFRYLRVRGKLPAGSVVTVEPGIYFCKFIIDPYLEDPAHSKFINKEVLDQYWDVGGVRIEDNILVTETGHENLTDVPRELDEMEALVSAA